MDLTRINNEFYQAKKQFSYVELHPTSDGNVYAKTALQPSDQFYIASIHFPNNYPNSMPRVFINKPTVDNASPHQYNTGNICYLHSTMWNPGIHTLSFVIARTAKWLSKYEIWKLKKIWPGAGIAH